jgi:lysophospholipase L1-like esterase
MALCVGIAEVVLRFHLVDAYYVWPPNLRMILRPDPSILHGITGPSTFTINSFGVRGGPFTREQRYRILAVGGSTTICTYLDDSETWTHAVQELLNDRLGAGTTWVGNVGRPGHKTQEHVLQVAKLLPQHPEIDAILLLVGVNDMASDLVSRGQAEAGEVAERPPSPSPATPEGLAFSIFPGWDEESPWYLRTAIGRWWTVHLKPQLEARGAPIQDERGALVERRRLRRKAASAYRRELPYLASALAVYARNLNEIIDTMEAAGVRAIFLTQPSLWRENLTRAESDLLWGGRTGLSRADGGTAYYAVEALAEAMKLYNEALLRVCRERGVECIDVQARVPRDATAFTDDAHFTELGARRVAEAVAEHLLATEPLVGWTRHAADAGARPESPEGTR